MADIEDPVIAVVAAPDPSTKSKLWRFIDRIAMPLFAFTIVGVMAFIAWYTFVRVPPFDPLNYSIQTVQEVGADGEIIVPTIDGYERPAVYDDATVPVSGELEVDAAEPVEVVGSIVWVQTQPGGFSCVSRDRVPGVIDPGKSIRTFDNEIPACVADRVALSGPSTWRITGDVEVRAPGGVHTTWTTETFWIVPRTT